MTQKKIIVLSLLIIAGLALLYIFKAPQTPEIKAVKSTNGISYWLQHKALWTPLMHAAYESDAQKIQELIAQGADVNAKTSMQNAGGPIHELSPLARAILAKSFDSIELLLRAGADVQDVFGGEFPGAGIPILGFALDSGSIDIIKTIIDAGANVNQLIEGGIFVEKHKGVRNNPLLTYAIANQMPREVIQLLIQHGADVNQMGYFKVFSLLHIAAATGQADIVRDLLAAGANKHLKNAEGETPIDFARKYGRSEIVEIFGR
jgi:ankyrin repeat protein